MGFVQTPTVTEPGDYAVRGGIIDVWPPGGADAGEARPLRRRAGRRAPLRRGYAADHRDAGTGRACAGLRGHPRRGRDHAVPAELPHRVRRRGHRRSALRGGQRGAQASGAEHWLPFFHERLETIFDYLPGATVTLDDQTTAQRIARWEAITDQYDTRATALSQKGRLDTVYKPVPPGQLYLDEAAWEAAIGARRVVQFSPLAQSPGPGVIDAGGRVGRDFAPERQSENLNLFGAWPIIFARFGPSGTWSSPPGRRARGNV
jgi:transcription-repair coupling factor (superfamily II helicase)